MYRTNRDIADHNSPKRRFTQNNRLDSLLKEIIHPTKHINRDEPLVDQERARIPPTRTQAISSFIGGFFYVADSSPDYIISL